jgi:hypothetical protein
LGLNQLHIAAITLTWFAAHPKSCDGNTVGWTVGAAGRTLADQDLFSVCGGLFSQF